MADLPRLRAVMTVIRQFSRASITSWPVVPIIKCKMCGADAPEIESPHDAQCPISVLEAALTELETSNG